MQPNDLHRSLDVQGVVLGTNRATIRSRVCLLDVCGAVSIWAVRLVFAGWFREARAHTRSGVYSLSVRGDGFRKRAHNYTIWSVFAVSARGAVSGSERPTRRSRLCLLGVCGAVSEGECATLRSIAFARCSRGDYGKRVRNYTDLECVRSVFNGWFREAKAQPCDLESVRMVFVGRFREASATIHLECVCLVFAGRSRDASMQPYDLECSLCGPVAVSGCERTTIRSGVSAWCSQRGSGKRSDNRAIWSVFLVFAGRFWETDMPPDDPGIRGRTAFSLALEGSVVIVALLLLFASISVHWQLQLCSETETGKALNESFRSFMNDAIEAWKNSHS